MLEYELELLCVSFLFPSKENLLIGCLFKVTKYCLLNPTRKIAALILMQCWNHVKLLILSMFISTINCSFHLISPRELLKWYHCHVFLTRVIPSPVYSLMEIDYWSQVLKIGDDCSNNNNVKIPFLTTTSLLSQWP